LKQINFDSTPVDDAEDYAHFKLHPVAHTLCVVINAPHVVTMKTLRELHFRS